MPRPVYFDTSVFLEIGAKGSKHAKNIRALLKELKAEKARIYTSIITIQEVSVLSYRRGKIARDDYGRVSEFARIVTINKEVALTAAKREAEIKDDAQSDVEDNRRRKWDCFHIATAQQHNCSVLYTTDKRLLNRQKQLGIVDVKFSLPMPMGTPELDFSAKPPSQPGAPSPQP